MIRKLQLLDVHPRRDTKYVLTLVERFLDSCDPDDRIDITLELPESLHLKEDE